jgi:HlyD family secretion protein
MDGMKQFFRKLTKKQWTFIGIGAVIVVIVLMVVGSIQKNANAASSYQTEALSRGSLTAIVGATGTVRAEQSTTLAWQTNGRIGTINVGVGDLVETGDVLAELAPSSLGQQIISAEASLVTAQRNLDDVMNSSLATAQAQLNLANAQDNYDTALRQRQYLDWQRGDQEQIDSAQADVTLAQEQVERMQEMFGYVSNLNVDNPDYAFALSNLSAAQNQLDIAEANLAYLQGYADSQEIAHADATLAVAQAQLDDAQREWERLQNGPDPDDIRAAQAQVDALQATLDMAYLTAPFNGSVTVVSSQVGDAVTAGVTSFRIDNLSHLFVDVNVTEVDINQIEVGQPVSVTFDAIQTTTYTGVVTEVARVGQVAQGSVTFAVTIEIEDADDAVLPGMTAATNITVVQLDDVLLIPNRAVRMSDGQRVVYVLRNGVPVAVQITLGASSDTYSELVEGDLQEGDLIVLNPSNILEMMNGGRPF